VEIQKQKKYPSKKLQRSENGYSKQLAIKETETKQKRDYSKYSLNSRGGDGDTRISEPPLGDGIRE